MKHLPQVVASADSGALTDDTGLCAPRFAQDSVETVRSGQLSGEPVTAMDNVVDAGVAHHGMHAPKGAAHVCSTSVMQDIADPTRGGQRNGNVLLPPLVGDVVHHVVVASKDDARRPVPKLAKTAMEAQQSDTRIGHAMLASAESQIAKFGAGASEHATHLFMPTFVAARDGQRSRVAIFAAAQDDDGDYNRSASINDSVSFEHESREAVQSGQSNGQSNEDVVLAPTKDNLAKHSMNAFEAGAGPLKSSLAQETVQDGQQSGDAAGAAAMPATPHVLEHVAVSDGMDTSKHDELTQNIADPTRCGLPPLVGDVVKHGFVPSKDDARCFVPNLAHEAGEARQSGPSGCAVLPTTESHIAKFGVGVSEHAVHLFAPASAAAQGNERRGGIMFTAAHNDDVAYGTSSPVYDSPCLAQEHQADMQRGQSSGDVMLAPARDKVSNYCKVAPVDHTSFKPIMAHKTAEMGLSSQRGTDFVLVTQANDVVSHAASTLKDGARFLAPSLAQGIVEAVPSVHSRGDGIPPDSVLHRCAGAWKDDVDLVNPGVAQFITGTQRSGQSSREFVCSSADNEVVKHGAAASEDDACLLTPRVVQDIVEAVRETIQSEVRSWGNQILSELRSDSCRMNAPSSCSREREEDATLVSKELHEADYSSFYPALLLPGSMCSVDRAPYRGSSTGDCHKLMDNQVSDDNLPRKSGDSPAAFPGMSGLPCSGSVMKEAMARSTKAQAVMLDHSSSSATDAGCLDMLVCPQASATSLDRACSRGSGMHPMGRSVTSIATSQCPPSEGARRSPSVVSVINRETVSKKARKLHASYWIKQTPDAAETRRGSSMLSWPVTSGWVNSPVFDSAVCVVLIIEAIVVGVQADFYAMQAVTANPSSQQLHAAIHGIEICFCAFFSFELATRIRDACTQRSRMREEFWWLCFDGMLVAFQLANLIFTSISGSGSGSSSHGEISMAIIRILRVFRLFRVLRVLRVVRFIGELRKVVYLIIGSLWSFFWAAMLLSLLIYVLAVFFTQIVADHVQDSKTQVGPLQAKFGTIGMSVLTLYKSISGGIDWQDASEPLVRHVSPILGAVFALYTAFALLVLMNLVTGVFVDSALHLSKVDAQRDLLRKVHRAFAATDADSSGRITWEEFRSQMGSEQMNEFFESLEISTARADDLFHLIDQRGDGMLSFEELVIGGTMLQGPAKAMDLATLSKSFENSMLNLQRELATIRVMQSGPGFHSSSLS